MPSLRIESLRCSEVVAELAPGDQVILLLLDLLLAPGDQGILPLMACWTWSPETFSRALTCLTRCDGLSPGFGGRQLSAPRKRFRRKSFRIILWGTRYYPRIGCFCYGG